MSTRDMAPFDAANFMALEPRLVALLKDAVAGLSPAVHVFTVADLADVQESNQMTPALHVVYGGYRIAQDIGTAWRLEHTWYAVAVCRSAATVRSGEKARQDAGILATRAALALAGARVAGAAERLALVSPPGPSYKAPYTYLPTAVRAVTHMTKPS
jgi:hypothetical protein